VGHQRSSTTAVIPALNEERSIGAVLDAIPRHLVDEIIVVDGGSSDNTVAVAAAHGATIVLEPRRGYGRACTVGANRARGEIVVFLDGDGAADPSEIAHLVAPIESGEADLVLGSRLTGAVAAGAMPWHQWVGNRLSARLIRTLYGQPLTDLGPFRVGCGCSVGSLTTGRSTTPRRCNSQQSWKAARARHMMIRCLPRSSILRHSFSTGE